MPDADTMQSTTQCPQCNGNRIAGMFDEPCEYCLLSGAVEVLNGEQPQTRELPKDYLAEVFPKLELGELLGTNMATVYKARHKSLKRDVVLKALGVEFARNPQDRSRFMREAQTLAKLDHPNIVGVHDCGSADGIDYLLMEYVEGASLRERIASGITQQEAVDCLDSILDALESSHAQGVLHRDLKPDNIILRADGEPVVIDFGLAKWKADADQLTATREGFGTDCYLAPEQRIDASLADERSDVFSLGAILCEIVTGRPPAGQIDDTNADDASLLRIAKQAMSQNPDDRFSSVKELRSAIRSGRAQTRSADSRHVGRVWVAASAALATCVLVGFALYALNDPGKKSRQDAVANHGQKDLRRLIGELRSDDRVTRQNAMQSLEKRFDDLSEQDKKFFIAETDQIIVTELPDPIYELWDLTLKGKVSTDSPEIKKFLKTRVNREKIWKVRELLACNFAFHQAGFESHKRKQCIENLRQIGIAILNYHGEALTAKQPIRHDPKKPGWGWAAQILPFVEQKSFFDNAAPNDRPPGTLKIPKNRPPINTLIKDLQSEKPQTRFLAMKTLEKHFDGYSQLQKDHFVSNTDRIISTKLPDNLYRLWKLQQKGPVKETAPEFVAVMKTPETRSAYFAAKELLISNLAAKQGGFLVQATKRAIAEFERLVKAYSEKSDSYPSALQNLIPPMNDRSFPVPSDPWGKLFHLRADGKVGSESPGLNRHSVRSPTPKRAK